ncbi:hypothetical protein FJT64_009410 [Amphibalanus amphitrite]|uniref:Reverse transcriptase domain-containing protein n=1 Tax=Amphibalanus amphitrite TaxID=1232801 RepID=A0A6A4VGC4_AMPAM|nr:hypothetical protein FJT64_009410 [Amphibalanus amphitrite]
MRLCCTGRPTRGRLPEQWELPTRLHLGLRSGSREDLVDMFNSMYESEFGDVSEESEQFSVSDRQWLKEVSSTIRKDDENHYEVALPKAEEGNTDESGHSDLLEEEIFMGTRLLARIESGTSGGTPDQDANPGSDLRSSLVFNIPAFDGDLMKWRAFWELFSVSIHQNGRYANIQKFVLLKSHLTGAAERAIEGIPVSGDGYITAIQPLEKRFHRDDLERENLMKQLLDAPTISNGNDLKAMRKLTDHLTAHTRALVVLGVAPDSFADFLLPVMRDKIPESWRLEWARQRKSSYQDFLKFLEQEATPRETARLTEKATSPGTSIRISVHNLNSKRNVACQADIKAAFHQVAIPESDRRYLQFLWHDQVLRFARVPFGLSCSPYMLLKTVSMHVAEYAGTDPELCSKIMSGSYMDDICITFKNKKEAQAGIERVGQIFSDARMELHKVRTSGETSPPSKLLGMLWSTETDYLADVIPDIPCPSTNSELLSAVAKPFDPLGVLTPWLIGAKIIFQSTWKSLPTLGWDDPLPADAQRQVEKWWAGTSKENVPFPRVFAHLGETEDVTFHVFCDASKSAYCTAVYAEHASATKETKETKEETKPKFSLVVNETTSTQQRQRIFDITTCSTLKQVVNRTSWAMRFVRNARGDRANRTTGPLTVTPEERRDALHFWIREAQQNAFHADLEALENGRSLLITSQLTKLRPQLDESGIICSVIGPVLGDLQVYLGHGHASSQLTTHQELGRRLVTVSKRRVVVLDKRCHSRIRVHSATR